MGNELVFQYKDKKKIEYCVQTFKFASFFIFSFTLMFVVLPDKLRSVKALVVYLGPSGNSEVELSYCLS